LIVNKVDSLSLHSCATQQSSFILLNGVYMNQTMS